MSSQLSATQVLELARAANNFAADVGLPQEFELGGETFVVCGCKAQDLSTKGKARIMDILRENMRTMYEEVGWGWKEVEKRKEVLHKESRFVLLSRKDNPLETVAYAIFRFVWDDDDEPEYPVLYCYELQVEKSAQNKGAGVVLMRMLQQIAEHYGMKKVSLTVFKTNHAAMRFYQKVGFVIDADSPSQYGEDECYEILSDRNYTPPSEQSFTRC